MSLAAKVFGGLIGLGLAFPALAGSYVVDASHSRVGFSVSHMTVSTVRGEFGEVSGTVEFDEKNVAGTKVSAKVGVASVDTRDKKRDEHLMQADFFEVAKFPEMKFESKSVKNASADGFDLVGDLTIRGVTKEVTFRVKNLTPEVQDPWGNTKRGTSATAKIDRQDFGLTFSATLDKGGLVVGNEVTIELDIELNKAK